MSISKTAEVVIAGGGVIGCSIAYQLSKAGKKVIVTEREEVAAEASRAAAGLLAPLGELSSPGPFTDLLLASWNLNLELIPVLEDTSGVRVEYHHPGSLHTVTDAEDAAYPLQQMKAWKALGLQVSWLEGDEAREFEPLLEPGVVAAVYSPRDGSIKPAAMTRAYAESARRQGVTFYEHTEITSIERSASRVTGVQIARGDVIACDHLVIAAGAWSARFGNWLGFSLPVSPMRGQILSLRQPASPLKHILFGEGVYLVPKLDGTIYVGATVEQVGFDKAVTAEGIAWLLSSAIKLVPSLASAPIANTWAGLRPWSPDSRPILGKAPGWENVTLATGHSATGFELSAITGKAIAELVVTGQTPAIMRAFGVERFSSP